MAQRFDPPFHALAFLMLAAALQDVDAATDTPPATNCSTLPTCQGCLATSACGWAADWKGCMAGGPSGPATGYSDVWMWSTCAAPPQPPFGFLHWSIDSTTFTNSQFQALAGALVGGSFAHWDLDVESTTSRGRLVGVDTATGATKWTRNTTEQYVWLSGVSDRFLAFSQHSVMALSAASGKPLWNVAIPPISVGGVHGPVWVGDDLIVFSAVSANASNHMMSIYRINTTDGSLHDLWNSQMLNLRGTDATFKPVMGNPPGESERSAFVVQLLGDSTFVVLNVSHPEGAAVVSTSGVVEWSKDAVGGPLRVVGDRIFLFGTDPGDRTTGRVVAYDLAGERIFISSFAGMGNLMTVVPRAERDPHTDQRRDTFAMVAVNAQGNCAIATGNSTSHVLANVTLRAQCTVAAQTEHTLFLVDSSNALYHYDLHSANVSWVTASLGNDLGTEVLKVRVFGRHLYAVYRQPFPSTYSEVVSFVAQIDVATGRYLAIFPVQWATFSYELPNEVFFQDPARRAVLALATSGVYRVSILSLTTDTTGAMLSLPHSANQAPVVSKRGGLQYHIGFSRVTCVSTANFSVLWTVTMAEEDLLFQPAPVILGSSLVLFSQFSNGNSVYVVPMSGSGYTVVDFPTWLPACSGRATPQGSLQSGQASVWTLPDMDAEGRWVYYASQGCLVRLSVSNGTAASLATKTIQAYAHDSRYLYYSSQGVLGAVEWANFSAPLSSRLMSSNAYQLVASPNGVLASRNDGWAEYSSAPQLGTLLDAATAFPVDTSASPLLMGTNLFLPLNNGSLVSYSIVSQTTEPRLRFQVSVPTTRSLGTPVVTPWGLLVYANDDGIFCVDSKSGAIPHTITQAAGEIPLRCAQPIAYAAGLVFVVCNGQLQMVDVVVGRIWRSGAIFPSWAWLYVTIDAADERAIIVTQCVSWRVAVSNLTDAPYESRNLTRHPPRYEDAEEDSDRRFRSSTTHRLQPWLVAIVVGIPVAALLVAGAIIWSRMQSCRRQPIGRSSLFADFCARTSPMEASADAPVASATEPRETLSAA